MTGDQVNPNDFTSKQEKRHGFFIPGNYVVDDFGYDLPVICKPYEHCLNPILSVKIIRTPNHQWQFILKLRSQLRKGINAVRLVNPAHPTLGSSEKVKDCIVLTGLLMAEHLNQRYGDNFNPDKVAKIALETFEDMLRKLESHKAFDG